MTWFTTKKLSEHVLLIQERLDVIEPRFHTTYTNMYLIMGKEKNALIDTGTGVSSLTHVLQVYTQEKELLVFNTHHHFDHVLGNEEFQHVFIHYMDFPRVAKPIDLSFLKGSRSKVAQDLLRVKGEAKRLNSNYSILYGDEEFDLGGIQIKVLFTPGHTPGSISLLSSEGDLFTGDTVHHGAVYIPNSNLKEQWILTLLELQGIQEKYADFLHQEKIRVYPGHESTPLNFQVITELYHALQNIEDRKKMSTYDEFLQAFLIKTPPFLLVNEEDTWEYTHNLEDLNKGNNK